MPDPAFPISEGESPSGPLFDDIGHPELLGQGKKVGSGLTGLRRLFTQPDPWASSKRRVRPLEEWRISTFVLAHHLQVRCIAVPLKCRANAFYTGHPLCRRWSSFARA